MSIPGWLRRIAALPIYPLLAGAYPVIYLYAQNVQEAINPSEVVVPLGISVGTTLVMLAALWALTRRRSLAAAATTLLVVLFYTYGMAWDWLGPDLHRHIFLVAIWAGLAILGLLVIWRFRALTDHVTLPFNILVSLGVAFNLLLIVTFVLNLRPTHAFNGSNVTASLEPVTTQARPDIYWIIPEEYGSATSIQDYFGYDNSPFVKALRDRGFYVADQSTANYLKTAPAILSTRDMDYLDAAALREQAHSGDDWGPLYRGLGSPFEVQEFLDGLGYRFIYAGTYWEPMIRHASADVNYVYDRLTPEFLSVLQRSTILRALEGIGSEPAFDWRLDRMEQTLYEMRSLDHASTLGGPKFVHAQLGLDHEPYVFHADGTFITAAEERASSHEALYVDQLQYTNTQLLAWIDQLLRVPEAQRPIIVLLSDEGPWPNRYRYAELTLDWTKATQDELREKFGILNAVYLPGKMATEAALYPSITPVNEFRVILDAAFGLDLPVLPDRNYIWPDQKDLYTYLDVTDQLR